MSNTTNGEGAILPSNCGGTAILNRGKFTWHTTTETGIQFRPGTPEDYWLERTREAIAIFESSRDLYTRALFAVGDCLAYGEKAFGETWSQAIDSTRKSIRLSEKRLLNIQWICGSVKPEIRREMLSMAHHEAVARLGADDQEDFLKQADENEWSVAELKKQIKKKYPATKRGTVGDKVVVDLSTEEGVAHALTKCADFLDSVAAGDGDEVDGITAADMSPERLKPLVEPFQRLAAFFAFAEPGALACIQGAAAFLENPDNNPIPHWSDERKDRWQNPLNDVSKAGRRSGLIGAAKPPKAKKGGK